ncbi:MAG: GGDEF domain-containing protein [Rubrivivax sp.]
MSLSPSPTQPAPLPADTPPRVPSSVRLSMAAAALLVAAGAALLAALVAWALNRGLGGTAWATPLGALLGVAIAVFPAALALQRLAMRQQSQSLVGGSLNTPLGAARPLFLELAGREWARARRYGSGAALLLVDVDRFARLTEARGSEAADAVLAELLSQTPPTLRGADLLTRFSDAQMAVLLAHADATGALDVAERIRERAEQLEVVLPHETPPKPLRLTVSVGVAQLRPAHLNLQSLIDDAQDAVLAARPAGGNCVRAAPVDLGRLSPTGGWRTVPRARP